MKIGHKIKGPTGTSHKVQAKEKKLPKISSKVNNAFASSKIQDSEAVNKAYGELKNPLAKRTITALPKGKYPLGGKTAGQINPQVPLNRMS